MGEDRNSKCNSASPPDGRVAAASRSKSGTGPSLADALLWGTLGCGAIVCLAFIVAGFGAVAYFMMARAPQNATAELEPDQDSSDDVAANQRAPGELPAPPLDLAVPIPPDSQLGKVNLADMDARSLSGAAHHFYGERRYHEAVQCQYQCVAKSHSGQYNLACFYGCSGDVAAALYWLQIAGREDGVDVQHASRDPDLKTVRKDPRWPQVRVYLRGCERYWEASGHSETCLVLPQNAPPGKPIPVFIGLHGHGHNALEFVRGERYQVVADQLGVAFLGVSGTHCRGKHSFVWSEDAEKDLARIDAALKQVADQLTPADGQIVLFGFSQGGAVSAELAARHPRRFAGAILLSPGSVTSLDPTRLPRLPENRRQGLVSVCGAREHPTTVNCTKAYAAAYQSRGSRVHLKLYPGMHQHTFPPDFAEQFPIWAKFILDPAASIPD